MSQQLREDLDQCLARTRDLWEDLRGERVFVTGATGFFGCWLLETLLWANRQLNLGTRVTILTRDPEAFRQKAPHLASDAALETFAGDVRHFYFPPGSYSHVIHAATESSAELNRKDPLLMFDTIVEGTRRCLEFAVAANARRFLFLSSGAVYGPQPADISHIPEDFPGVPNPLDAASAYAEGKRAGELLCSVISRGTSLEPTIARCFAFAGPYMKLDAHFAIGNFIRDHLRGGPIRVAGDGSPLRSYMYAGELMTWLWTILFRGKPLRPYNVGSEESISIAELAKAVSKALEPLVPVEITGKAGAGPAHRYVPSTVRARTELGLECRMTLDEIIRRTHRWFKETAPELERAR